MYERAAGTLREPAICSRPGTTFHAVLYHYLISNDYFSDVSVYR